MDPQMVWDMMDESETEVDSHTSMCQSLEPEDKKENYKERPQPSTRGWMGFPVYGLSK